MHSHTYNQQSAIDDYLKDSLTLFNDIQSMATAYYEWFPLLYTQKHSFTTRL